MNLGPAIRKNSLTKNLNIMIQDTSRDVMPDFPHTVSRHERGHPLPDLAHDSFFESIKKMSPWWDRTLDHLSVN